MRRTVDRCRPGRSATSTRQALQTCMPQLRAHSDALSGAAVPGTSDSVATVEHVSFNDRGRVDWELADVEARSRLADAEVRRTLAEEQGLSDAEIEAIDQEIHAILDAEARRQCAAREAARAEISRELDAARERRDAVHRKFIRVWLGSSLATMLVVGTVSGDFNTGMEFAVYVLLGAPFALAGLALVIRLIGVPFAIVEEWKFFRRRRQRRRAADT